MTCETFGGDYGGRGAPPQRTDHGWRINRLDVRSPLSQLPGHTCRVELDHPERGRVTDIGSGLDILSAAFAAVAHIFSCKPAIVSVHSRHRECAGDDARDRAMAAVVIELDGCKRRGTATGHDLIYACLSALIDALTNADDRNDSLLSAGLNHENDVGLLATRPCQASGIDENGDWWLFASDDAGAAEAVAAEFQDEGYRQVRVSLPNRNPAIDTKHQ